MYELTDQNFPYFYDSLSRELSRLFNEQKGEVDLSIQKDNQITGYEENHNYLD